MAIRKIDIRLRLLTKPSMTPMLQVGTGFLLGKQSLSKVRALVRVLRIHLQSTVRNLKSKIHKGA